MIPRLSVIIKRSGIRSSGVGGCITWRRGSSNSGGGGGRSANLSSIQDEFTRQSVTFERDWNQRSSRSTKEIMSWVTSHMIIPTNSNLCLDVAAGTCIFARTLAYHFSNVVALDATKAMLSEGEKLAALEKLSNIKFVVGDASMIPYPDNSFDVVACRLCIHHFDNPFEKIKEMARVLKPGGTCVVVDIVSSDNEGEAKEQNRLEILRDNSHTRMLPLQELIGLLERSGLKPTHSKLNTPTIDNAMNLSSWMDSTKTDFSSRIEIEKSINAELTLGGKNGPKTGFQPFLVDSKVHFIHKYAIVQARK